MPKRTPERFEQEKQSHDPLLGHYPFPGRATGEVAESSAIASNPFRDSAEFPRFLATARKRSFLLANRTEYAQTA
jgi:hypothetical protein